MRPLLLFTLAGPLMAFGDVAPGERRVSLTRPGRSALLGLIAAALGLRREDERQDGLAAQFAFAVRVDAPGTALVDYHTAQSAPARRKRRFATRREELAIPREERTTILSQRSYRADAAFTIAALPLGREPYLLEAIEAALRQPALPIHAGRRACPLALPPSPRIVEADALAAAFAAYDEAENGHEDRAGLRRLCGIGRRGETTLAVEEAFVAAGLLPENVSHRRETRRDAPMSRTRWQFATRPGLVLTLGGAAP